VTGQLSEPAVSASRPTRDERIAIIGLGYVGLPLAISFVEAGLTVEGIDAHAPRIVELNEGRSPIDDIGDERLRAALERGLRVVATAESELDVADVVFVCVPTPITKSKDPDLGPVLAAATLIREHLRPGQLIVLQSTTFPGTTNGPFRAELERSGLVAGRDFDLAFAPERVNPGDPASASKGVPRLVGATSAAATVRAGALLRRGTVLVDQRDPERHLDVGVMGTPEHLLRDRGRLARCGGRCRLGSPRWEAAGQGAGRCLVPRDRALRGDGSPPSHDPRHRARVRVRDRRPLGRQRRSHARPGARADARFRDGRGRRCRGIFRRLRGGRAAPANGRSSSIRRRELT